MNILSLYGSELNKSKTGKTRSNIEKVIPNIIHYISIKHSYLVAGHGAHTRKSDYFKVPDGKYVIFFSNPGVSLSERLIANTKFQGMLQNPLALSQFITGNLKRDNVPNFLRYSRTNFNWKKTLYTPNSMCPNLHLQFWDTGNLDKYMGVWTLPDFRPRKYKGQVKTLEEIMKTGPPGVYFVYACRITPGDVNWSNVREVYNRSKTILPNLQNYNTWLGTKMNTNNNKSNYLSQVRARLQNVGRLQLASANTSISRNIAKRENETYRLLFRKRISRN